ncbi:hypothetical protein BH11PSE11_BH11PSE11_32400 [soil metagenome]
MYRIPANLDLTDLVGADLEQICLGGADVQFVFGTKATVAVQSRVSVFENDDLVAEWDEEENWCSLSFQRLLNATVQGYRVINEQTLEIQFADGLKLQLHDESDQYESMQIYYAGDANGPIVI